VHITKSLNCAAEGCYAVKAKMLNMPLKPINCEPYKGGSTFVGKS